MYKYLSALLAGALATLGIIYATQKAKVINVANDYIEKQKKTDNTKIKAKKGIFGFLKGDPGKREARKKRRALRKQNK